MPTYRPAAETVEAVQMPAKGDPAGLGAVYASGLITGAQLGDNGVMCRFVNGVRSKTIPFSQWLVVEGDRVKVLPPEEFERSYVDASATPTPTGK